MDKISIIVPIYKAEKYLKECLDSIINQTYSNLEIILINDGSPDSCPQIIDEYAQKDNRIIVIHKENGGYASAINKGLEVLSGKYFAIVESDDYCALNMIEKMYEIISAKDAEIAIADYFCINNTQTNNTNLVKFNKNILFNEYGYSNLKISPSLINKPAYPWKNFYKTSFIKKYNIKMVQDGFGAYEDCPWNAEILSNAEKIVHVPTPVYYYRKDSYESSCNTGKRSVINYIKRREQAREILIKNNCYSNEVIEYHWRRAYYCLLKFYKKINKKHKKEYYYAMQKFLKYSAEDNLKFKHFTSYATNKFKIIMNEKYYIFLLHSFKNKLYMTYINIKISLF